MVKLIIICLFSSSLCNHSFASAANLFMVNKSCPAYLSKNKKTNPDNLLVQPGQQYEIKAVNQPTNPQWYRVELKNSQSFNPLRWVNANCGELSGQALQANDEICVNNRGLADSYVLALSWQPAYCQVYGNKANKPECRKNVTKTPKAKQLILHGLWPNQGSCGQQYGFCGVKPRHRHCDYTPVILSADVAKHLSQYMPSIANGSCLERFEWYKHGSCQSRSADEYFTLAMRLNHEASLTPFAQFLQTHGGGRVEYKQLRELLTLSFGPQAAYKVYLGCRRGLLVDIHINLPGIISQNESLNSLIKNAPDSKRLNTCPSMVRIANFN